MTPAQILFAHKVRLQPNGRLRNKETSGTRAQNANRLTKHKSRCERFSSLNAWEPCSVATEHKGTQRIRECNVQTCAFYCRTNSTVDSGPGPRIRHVSGLRNGLQSRTTQRTAVHDCASKRGMYIDSFDAKQDVNCSAASRELSSVATENKGTHRISECNADQECKSVRLMQSKM